MSIFLKPMASEFGWSRSLITGAIAFGSILGAIASPFIGPMLDRHGPRLVAFFGILALSAGLMAMSFLSQIWQLYLFFGIGRMIAVGILSLVIAVTISNWFYRKRGRAMGVAQLGSRVGTTILPPIVQFIILSHGWRVAWGALSILVFVLSALPSLILLKRKPEDMGLQPDGLDRASIADAESGSAIEAVNGVRVETADTLWSRRQVLFSSTFWWLIALSSFLRFSGAGTNFHIFPFMTDQGISPTLAVLAISVINISGAAGGVILGFLAERFERNKMLAVVLVLLAFAFLSVFLAVERTITIFFYAVVFGLLRGGMMPLVPLVWADCYGRASLGTVLGLSGPFRLFGNALGPVFGAVCFDLVAGYAVPFSIYAGLFLLAGVIALFVKPPIKSERV
jgi:MFS family permease